MVELRSKNEYEKQAPWSNLPSLALEKIYSFLSPGDRVNMSLVSPNWSDEFELPSLWRSFRFTMTKHRLLEDNTCTLMNCVRKYSKYFKHVSIYFDSDMVGEEFILWSEHFKEFLQILTKTCQLYSVKIVYLGRCFETLDLWKQYSTCESIFADLDLFFRSQRNLKRFVFRGSYFKDRDGVLLVKEVVKNCKNSLKHLALQDFFHWEDEKQNPTTEQLLPSILSLPNLMHLEIDYWLIFGKKQAILSDVLKKLSNCRKDTYLRILTDFDELISSESFELLTSSDWSHLKRQYPCLDMELIVDRFSAIQIPLKSSIIEHMPISQLSYNLGYRDFKDSLEVEIDGFLNHIIACKISNDLVSLTLEWSKPIPDVASVFIPFLEVCNKLKTFALNLVYPSNQLDVLLESLLNNKPQSLEELKLTIWKVEKEQVKPLRKLGLEFESRLKTVKLNLKLLVEEIDPEDDEDDESEEEYILATS